MSDGTKLISFVKSACNELQSSEVAKRRKALQELDQEIFSSDLSPQDLYDKAFAECHLPLMKCFRDKSETCRERTILLMRKFIGKLDRNDYYLTYIFPALVERIGTVELVEESEELRLELVEFLDEILNCYSRTECLVPFLNDIVQILGQTVTDKYPKVKESSCKCICDLAKALPRHFHLQCESLIKPVLKAFTHQHFRVRVAAITAIGQIIMHSTSGTALENVVGPLAEKLFDQTPAVRRIVVQVAALLLTEYRDRYSHFHRLLPLILTCLCDEVPETRIEAEKLWACVGEQYEKENEKDIKDQLDYPIGVVEHYPKDVQRPNLGCRLLVQRNTSKMIKAICSELRNWQDDIRVRCAQLLCSVVLHCEQFFTQNLQDVIPTICIACTDQDRRVYDNVMISARLIGSLVPARSWTPLMMRAVKEGATYGHFRALKCMVMGAPTADVQPFIRELADLLASEQVRCGNRKFLYLKELTECCKIFLVDFKTEVSLQMFLTLITIVAIRPANDEGFTVANSARELLKEVPESEVHAAMLLQQLLNEEANLITAVSPDRCVFDVLISEWGPALTPYLQVVSKLLIRTLSESCDADARLKTFESLSNFLQSDALLNCSAASEFGADLLTYVLIPSMIWRAGRTAEALRAAAAFCAWQTLHCVNAMHIDEHTFNALVVTLVSSLEDALWRTRVYCTKALECFDSVVNGNEERCRKWINDAIGSLLKKLDDPNDTVRLEAMNTLNKILQQYTLIEEVKLKCVVDSVMLHVDDEDKIIQNKALDILKSAGKADWNYLETKLLNDKHMYKNEDICNGLITYLNDLKT